MLIVHNSSSNAMHIVDQTKLQMKERHEPAACTLHTSLTWTALSAPFKQET